MCKYPWECLGSCLILLPIAGVCNQRSEACLRLLLTAGVYEQRLGGFFRLLLTAGVCEERLSLVLRPLLTASICDQRLDALLRILPTTGVRDQRLGTVPRLLPTAGVYHQHLDPVLDFCKCLCMPPALRHICSGFSGIYLVSCNSTSGRNILFLIDCQQSILSLPILGQRPRVNATPGKSWPNFHIGQRWYEPKAL